MQSITMYNKGVEESTRCALCLFVEDVSSYYAISYLSLYLSLKLKS